MSGVLYCGDGHQVAALMTWKGDVPSLAVWRSLQQFFRQFSKRSSQINDIPASPVDQTIRGWSKKDDPWMKRIPDPTSRGQS